MQQGSSFTSKHFEDFCKRHSIQHILTAVATPRANWQVERFNRTDLNSLLTSRLEEDKWNENTSAVQFATNNLTNNFTGKTLSELLSGSRPRGTSDQILIDEDATITQIIKNFEKERAAVG